jgi:peptidoglycan/LPS O-acetylase OafA/YrhL
MTTRAYARANFRSDVNGLRAWAVVAVVLYHFGVPGLGGGFIGVDVFFVISGFLMTGIVISGLERGDFSIPRFYMARARRIVPALLALCLTLLAVGWLLLPSVDYRALGVQAASSSTFLSNVEFWLEAGYFDASSHDKWLLHTWSLAVEWQFYLVLPVALSVLWKMRPGRHVVLWAIIVGFAGSFALAVQLTPLRPTGSFFMLPTRAWEMLAGGWVYFLANRWKFNIPMRQMLEICGLVLILASIAVFDSSSAWPGWHAALPVAGTVLVLLANRVNSPMTANQVAQWLGTRSYSVYLWHWPVVVSWRYMDWLGQPSAVAAGLLITCLLGHFSYRYVEVSARARLNSLNTYQGAGALIAIGALVVAAGGAIEWNKGFPMRFPHELQAVSEEALNMNPRRGQCNPGVGVSSPSCVYGGQTIRAIMIGDSHGDALVTALAQAVDLPGGVMQWTYSACPTLQGTHNILLSQNQCGAFVDWVLARLQTMPSDIAVVVVNRHAKYAKGDNEDSLQRLAPRVYFTHKSNIAGADFLREYASHLTATACNLAKNHKVYLVRPIPEMGIDVPHTARAMVWGVHKEVTLSLNDYHARNDFAWAAQDEAHDRCGVEILDPLPYLCWDGVCHGSKEGRPLYYDDNHLSEFGNKLLVPMFARIFVQPT